MIPHGKYITCIGVWFIKCQGKNEQDKEMLPKSYLEEGNIIEDRKHFT